MVEFEPAAISSPGAPNMACGYLGDVQLVVHNGNAPSNPEWDSYLKSFLPYSGRVKAGIVYTFQNGGPNAKQRAQATEFWSGRAMAFAVMTESMKIRAMVTAFSFFMNNRMTAFKPTDLKQAMAHLSVRADEADVRRALQKMARGLNCPEALGGL